MIALAFALAGLCVLTTGSLVAALVWYRGAVRELSHARDVLGDKDIVISTVTEERNRAVIAHRVADDQLTTERNLRAIAEAARNSALEKVRELLRKHIATATNEEIQELTNDAFTTPLALAPRVPAQVPRRSDAGPDALLDPFADVRPAKPA